MGGLITPLTFGGLSLAMLCTQRLKYFAACSAHISQTLVLDHSA